MNCPRVQSIIASILLGFLIPGCVTLSEPVRVTREISQKRTDIRDQRPGNIEVTDSTWSGDVLNASIRAQKLCYPAIRIDRTFQTYEERRVVSTGWLAAYYVLGVLGIVGGAALLGVTPQMSSEPGVNEDGEETLSPKGSGILGGGALAGCGLASLIYGLVQSGKARDRKIGELETKTDIKQTGPDEICGTADTPAGEIVAGFEHNPSVKVAVAAGQNTLKFDFSAFKRQLCLDEANIGKPLNVWFVPADGTGHAELGSLNVDDCILVNRIVSLITGSADLLNGMPESVALIEAGNRLRLAASLAARLSPTNPERQNLINAIKSISNATAETASAALDVALNALPSSPSDDVYQTRASQAFSIAELLPGRKNEVWVAVYSGWRDRLSNAGDSGLTQLMTMARGDSAISECLSGTHKCLEWLPRSDLELLFSPVFIQISGILNNTAATARQATAAYRRSNSRNDRSELGTALAMTSKLINEWCPGSSDWDEGLESACRNGTSSYEDGVKTLETGGQ